MKIGMVLQADFPPDIRVEKEAQSLLKAGHEVFLLCRNKAKMALDETVNGIHVHRLKPFIHNVLSIPLYFNPIWKSRLFQMVRDYQLDVIHVHDLPLVPLGLQAARKFKVPLVYDMHENYPAAMDVWKRPNLTYWTIKNPRLALYLDRWCQQQADEIIVVVEEQKENLIEQGLPADKITVVSNTVDLSRFDQQVEDKKVIKKWQKYFTLLYLGGFSPDRDLETPIRAMKEVVEKIPTARLLLVGGGSAAYTRQLQQLISAEGVEDGVEWIPWVQFNRVRSYLQAAAVGIIPQPSNPFIDTTIPHKLFQYMAFRLPVIVSDARPLARIVKETTSGEVFKSGDTTAFCEAVNKIYHAKISYGENGHSSVKNKYNWQQDAEKLIKLYERLKN